VVQVVVPTDRSTGQQRGFAFVEYANPEHVGEAIQKFDGYELDGRGLRVNEASSERPGRPMGGGADHRPAFRPRPKGSRRNVRARKRSIW
jgi:cold-inducible RNA-binding protein